MDLEDYNKLNTQLDTEKHRVAELEKRIEEMRKEKEDDTAVLRKYVELANRKFENASAVLEVLMFYLKNDKK